MKTQFKEITLDALLLKSQTKKSLELGSRKWPGEVMWCHPECRWRIPQRSDMFMITETLWLEQQKNSRPHMQEGWEPLSDHLPWECWPVSPPCTLLALILSVNWLLNFGQPSVPTYPPLLCPRPLHNVFWRYFTKEDDFPSFISMKNGAELG